MNTLHRITVGYAYQRADKVYPVNMQVKTLAGYLKQTAEALLHSDTHVVKWVIKKKVTTEA